MRMLPKYLRGTLLAAPLIATAALAQGGPPAGKGPGMPNTTIERGQPDRIDRPMPGAPGQIDKTDRTTGHADHHTAAKQPLDARLEADTKLSSALTASFSRRGIALPEGGLSVACTGFSSVGECVAAINAANNLSLTGGFAALKTAMTTGEKQSLGQAIKTLKPDADVAAAERQARLDAKRDLNEAAGTLAGR